MLVGLLALLLTPGQSASPQTTPKPQTVLGEVTALGAGGASLTVRTDPGESIAVLTDARTSLLRARPGAKDLSDATPIALAEITVGDRVLARGLLAADARSMAARQVVLMTREDISQKQERERADWRRRGIVGVITLLDPERKQISLEVRSLGGAKSVTIPAGDGKPSFRRYAPDSVKFSDARPSSFEELRVGDQLRALGEKSEDGARFAAEQIVSGAFRSVSGTVTAVDPQKQELNVKDAQSGKPFVVAIGKDALLRRLPAALPPAGGPELLERLPAITIADLKAGDLILVSSTKGADPQRLNAIALVSGLEALAAEPGSRRRGEAAQVGLPSGFMEMGIGLIP
jgi:hypothetical protein